MIALILLLLLGLAGPSQSELSEVALNCIKHAVDYYATFEAPPKLAQFALVLSKHFGPLERLLDERHYQEHYEQFVQDLKSHERPEEDCSRVTNHFIYFHDRAECAQIDQNRAWLIAFNRAIEANERAASAYKSILACSLGA